MIEIVWPTWIGIWGLALLALANVLLMVASALIERSGPIRLHHWAENAGEPLRALYDAPQRFETFRLLLSFLARWSLAPLMLMVWALLTSLGVDGMSGWIALATVGGLTFVVEWFNRWLVERHSEEALQYLTSLLNAIRIALLPMIWIFSRFVAHAALDEDEDEDEDEASEDEIDAYIDVGRREGILEPEEEELVRSIVDFGDTQVRSVMKPRVEVVAAPVDKSLEELAELFFTSKHARIPIYRDSIDHVIGILHIRDVFETLHERLDKSVEELAKPPHHVPESKPLRTLLEEMQTLQQQMAIVVDEYGGVAGLVTVEDLIEEIVGEISDEHETPGDHRQQLDNDTWRLEGRTHLEELGELFDVDLDEGPYETISGLICGELGYVPKPGQTIAIKGLALTVDDANERRVKLISVRRIASEQMVESQG